MENRKNPSKSLKSAKPKGEAQPRTGTVGIEGLPEGAMILKDAKGRLTHIVLPWDVWARVNTMMVEPDEEDLEAIARLERLPPSEFEPLPVTNPIRTARLAAGVLQTDLAEAMGITQGRLSRLEREGGKPEEETIHRALLALAELEEG